MPARGDAAPEQAGGRARGALRYAFTSHACGGNARRAASTERARCIGFRQRDFGCAGASTQPRAAADVARRHHADRRGLVDFACADARAGGRRRGRHQRWFCERWLRRKRLQWNCGGPRDLCQRLWWRWRRWWRGRRRRRSRRQRRRRLRERRSGGRPRRHPGQSQRRPRCKYWRGLPRRWWWRWRRRRLWRGGHRRRREQQYQQHYRGQRRERRAWR